MGEDEALWRRQQARDGRSDARGGRTPTSSDADYQRGYREGSSLTETDRRILLHLADQHTCYGRHMAEALWGGRVSMQRPYGRGPRASVRGKPMPGLAGRLMTAMAARGLVLRERTGPPAYQSQFSITPKGQEALA